MAVQFQLTLPLNSSTRHILVTVVLEHRCTDFLLNRIICQLHLRLLLLFLIYLGVYSLFLHYGTGQISPIPSAVPYFPLYHSPLFNQLGSVHLPHSHRSQRVCDSCCYYFLNSELTLQPFVGLQIDFIENEVCMCATIIVFIVRMNREVCISV